MIKVPSNIAPGCACRQSSVDPQAVSAGADTAVNGNKTGQAAFTTCNEAAPWWQIDLEHVAALDSVVVYNWDVIGLPYSEAGRRRARFLQAWTSVDGENWQLMHDRRDNNASAASFGGIHNGPLCIVLDRASWRYVKLTLAGGGILQLDEVEVYAIVERDADASLREMLQCAADLSFAMARRILQALPFAATALPAHIARLGISLNHFSTAFVAHLLVETHQGEAALQLLIGLLPTPQAGGAGTPAGASAPQLSIDIAPHPLQEHSGSTQAAALVPPAALALVAAWPQALLAVQAGGQGVAYLLERDEARLLCHGGTLCGPAHLYRVLEKLFSRHPGLERVYAAEVMEAAETGGYHQKTRTGDGIVLDLTPGMASGALANATPELHAAIGAMETGISQMQLRITRAADLDPAVYWLAIDAAMPGGAGMPWDTLQAHTSLVELRSASGLLASALCLEHDADCHLLACQAGPQAAGQDGEGLLDLLEWRLAGDLARRGLRHLHLHCRDAASHRRFGACTRARYTFCFLRQGERSRAARVRTALALGQQPARIEADLECALDTWLGADFEPTLQVDFDAIVENAVLGTDSHARRYQATMHDAFFMMMAHIPFDASTIFVDVGCGKGKMLYYAYRLGYRSCLGMEISSALLLQARANFERLCLPLQIRLRQRDASRLPLEELSGLSLFYLANPFGEEIMDAFLRSLVESQRREPRTLRIVYCVAMVEAPFAVHGFTAIKVFDTGIDHWRFPRSLIYERRSAEHAMPDLGVAQCVQQVSRD
ncbi:methyltransferase domain-containing protein [Massilia genomosp. 1]|uniref:Methyltransferase domain-containing protein n=1 Tax=Massilia genomosp. 1 TaxID=2609280 RepID=A0ABX0N478_9BURK|nr:methyltransferase domain-containing protein [Massilia genomosp. 1]NHZ64914.1 methyltransferase domain-containing protein [Massilia genomosp. 1]